MPRPSEDVEKLIYGVIGAFYYVYNQLGFGFREKVYAAAIERLLIRRGYLVEREVYVPIYMDEEQIALDRVDMIVEKVLIVENKAGKALEQSGLRQLYNYLHGSMLENGLLLHFGPKPRFYRQYIPNRVTKD